MDNLKPLKQFANKDMRLRLINTIQTALFAVLTATIYDHYGFSTIVPIAGISVLVILWLIILIYIIRKEAGNLINIDKQYRK